MGGTTSTAYALEAVTQLAWQVLGSTLHSVPVRHSMAAQPRLLAHLSAAGLGVSGTQLARHWASSMQVVLAMQRATAQLPGALTHLVLGGNKAGAAAAGTAAAGWVVGLGLVVVGLVTHLAWQVLLSSWHNLPLLHSIRAQPLRAQGLVGAAAAGVAAAWIGLQEGRQVTGSCTHRVPDLQRTAAQRLNPQEEVLVVVGTAAAWTGAQVALQVTGSSTHRVPEMQRTAAQPLVPHEAGATSAAAVVGCLGTAVALQEDLQVQGSTLHV